jgi:hypothetical protein
MKTASPDLPDTTEFNLARLSCDHSVGCITCSDEGIPMRVVSYSNLDGIVWCSTISTPESDDSPEAGDRKSDDPGLVEVMTGVVTPVAIGDTLLIHAGTALLKLPAPSDRTPILAATR